MKSCRWQAAHLRKVADALFLINVLRLCISIEFKSEILQNSCFFFPLTTNPMKKNWTLLRKVCQRTDKQLSVALLFVRGMHFFIYDKHCVFLAGWAMAQNQSNCIVRECVLWMYASGSGHTHRGKWAGEEHTAGRTRAQLHASTIKHFWFNQMYEKNNTFKLYMPNTHMWHHHWCSCDIQVT